MSLAQKFSFDGAETRRTLIGRFSPLSSDTPIVVHSDLFRLGLPDGRLQNDEICKFWLDSLLEAAGPRPLLVPTFNYDFCRSGVYDIENAPAEIGQLPKYCSSNFNQNRTENPVFSFCLFGNTSLDANSHENPFVDEGLFGWLHKSNAAIVFLGCDLQANTYVHHVEEQNDIGYRYYKRFSGKSVRNGKESPASLTYRVRPRVSNSVIYGDLGESLLDEKGALARFEIGIGQAMMFRTEDYSRLVGQELARDETWLLTNESRQVIKDLYAKNGYPLTVQSMEPG
jgi:aminoglycoside N3'-acetyltransferase